MSASDVVVDQPSGPGLDPEIGVAGVPAGVSVIEHLHQVQARIADEERDPLTIEVPEWQGALAVIFRYPEQGATPIIRAGMRMQGLKPERALDAGLDVLVAAASEVVAKRPGDQDWQPLDPSGAPVKIGARLAVLLGWEVPSEVKAKARFVARLLWSPRAAATGRYEGDLAAVNAAGDVTEYLRGVQGEIEDELAGE